MLFKRAFANAQILGDHLVDGARDHPLQDFPFPRRQSSTRGLKVISLVFPDSLRPIDVQSVTDSFDQPLVIRRLLDEIQGAGFHGPQNHGDVAMAAQQNDGWMYRHGLEVVQEFQPIHPGHAHIEQQATWCVGFPRFEKPLGRLEQYNRELDRLNKRFSEARMSESSSTTKKAWEAVPEILILARKRPHPSGLFHFRKRRRKRRDSSLLFGSPLDLRDINDFLRTGRLAIGFPTAHLIDI